MGKVTAKYTDRDNNSLGRQTHYSRKSDVWLTEHTCQYPPVQTKQGLGLMFPSPNCIGTNLTLSM